MEVIAQNRIKAMAVRNGTVILVVLMRLGLSAWAVEPLPQAIDQLIAAQASGPLAGRSDDAEFLRRITLDLSGQIPTSAEVRAFLANPSADKRYRLIDQLLASKAFAEHWSDRLSVILLERQDLGEISQDDWRAYLKRTLQGQPKWDAMVRELIAATGKGDSRPAMKFLGNGDHHRLTEDIARLFLGRDLKCARCHDHPSVDEWKQAHYWGLFAYLNQTKPAAHAEDSLVYFVENLATDKVEFQSVFSKEKETIGPKLPGVAEVSIPRFEKGQEYEAPAAEGLPGVPKFRPRERLAEDLSSKENRPFVRNSVNRLWFLMMGRGLWHPLDQSHAENPPSHPALLDLLESEFAVHDFDLKWFLRQIALSESYQRSSRLPDGVVSVDPESYRAALPKGLTPEQLLDAALRATGNFEQVKSRMPLPNAEKFDRRGYFTGTNQNRPETYQDIRTIFVDTFGGPAGFPEDEFAPGLNKALFLMNDRLILHWLQPHDGNLVERLSAMESPEEIAEELYLSILSRFPDDDERQEVAGYLNPHAERRTAALGDLGWALLTSTEFRLNH